MRHLNKYIHPVNERSADTPLIPGNQTERAGALSKRVTIVATGAWVHSPDQHKVSGEGYTALGLIYIICSIHFV